MTFARKVWKMLVAIKDGLVLLLILMFFMGLYALLSMRPAAHEVVDGALLVKLDGVVVEEPQAFDPLAVLASRGVPTREHRFRDVLRAIEGAATDDRIKAVVLDLDEFLGAGPAHTGELGEALDKVRAAKKPVLAHAIVYTGPTMQLAAHASEIWLDPMGGALVTGPGGTILFYGELAEKLGVNVHVYKAGRYKSAVEPYSRTSFSDDARADLTALLDGVWQVRQDDVAKARPKAKFADIAKDPVAAIRAAGGDAAKAALAYGLVDKLGTREDFAARVAKLVGKDKSEPDNPAAFAHTGYQVWNKAEPAKKAGKAIGVVTIAGEMVGGNAGPGTAGGDRIAALIDDALDDDLAALVIRIDSPGGLVSAAERMRQAILRHKAKGIPIVASMANSAASGGYYVATPATTIFAEPSTVTGSIGVFLVMPSVEGTLDKFGVRTESLRTTPLAGQPDFLGGLSPEVDEIMQMQTENQYDRFLDLVGKSRGKTRDQMLEVAEGRMWPGGAARQVGLVDRLGGLNDAVAFAAKEAGLKDGEWHAQYIEPEPDRFATFVQGLIAPEEEAAEPVGLAEMAVAGRDAAFAAMVRDMQLMLFSGPSVQARCMACPPLVGSAAPQPSGAQVQDWLAAFEALASR
ncbi:signal peptide peptidase SppA [Croceicoccus bisphenolivorans]|uniref:signal peptide peptidase SppA n=1 Tax=Croceicoccus bisphenolivorans TaxID=1783232 RepID=UPI00082D17AF|nr:signal peptide peptidase SppA [Croceicoccus bisphenolivorans]